MGSEEPILTEVFQIKLTTQTQGNEKKHTGEERAASLPVKSRISALGNGQLPLIGL